MANPRKIQEVRAKREARKKDKYEQKEIVVPIQQPERKPTRPITEDQIEEINLLKATFDKLSHFSAYALAAFISPSLGGAAVFGIAQLFQTGRLLNIVLLDLVMIPSIKWLHPFVHSKILRLLPGQTSRLALDDLKEKECDQVDQLIKEFRSAIPKSVRLESFLFAQSMIFALSAALVLLYKMIFAYELSTMYMGIWSIGVLFALSPIIHNVPKLQRHFNIVDDNKLTDGRINLNLITQELGQDSWELYKKESFQSSFYVLKIKRLEEISGRLLSQILISLFKKYDIPLIRKDHKELMIYGGVTITHAMALKINAEIKAFLAQFTQIDLLRSQLIRLGKQLHLLFNFEQSQKDFTHRFRAQAYVDEKTLTESVKRKLSVLFGKNIEFKSPYVIVTALDPVSDSGLRLIQAPAQATPSAQSAVPQLEMAGPTKGISSHAYLARELQETKEEQDEAPATVKQSTPRKIIQWNSGTYDSRAPSSIKPMEGGPTPEDRVFVLNSLKKSDFAGFSNGDILCKRFGEQADHPKITTRQEKQGIALGRFGQFTDNNGVTFDCGAKFKLLGPNGGNVRIYCTTETAPTGEMLIVPKIIKPKSHKKR